VHPHHSNGEYEYDPNLPVNIVKLVPWARIGRVIPTYSLHSAHTRSFARASWPIVTVTRAGLQGSQTTRPHIRQWCYVIKSVSSVWLGV